jgi:phage-related minor tail protein
LPGLAEGGPAEKGKPYMVGEKGPELFVPKAAGTVIPNDKLAAAPMSAPQQQPVVNNYNYNNNINAVDAKSVATLFYENRKALFGATNQARRELPYGAAA